MVLQMDELKPERSGRGSGLDWDTRGMTSALLLYKLFKNKKNQRGHLAEPNSFTYLHLACPSGRKVQNHLYFDCCSISLLWPNFILRILNSLTLDWMHVLCTCMHNVCVSVVSAVSRLSFTFEKPHDVLGSGSLFLLAAALCFYSDQVRPFRYLSFHLNWLAVWRSDRPYCLHFWWKWLLQNLFFCVCLQPQFKYKVSSWSFEWDQVLKKKKFLTSWHFHLHVKHISRDHLRERDEEECGRGWVWGSGWGGGRKRDPSLPLVHCWLPSRLTSKWILGDAACKTLAYRRY